MQIHEVGREQLSVETLNGHAIPLVSKLALRRKEKSVCEHSTYSTTVYTDPIVFVAHSLSGIILKQVSVISTHTMSRFRKAPVLATLFPFINVPGQDADEHDFELHDESMLEEAFKGLTLLINSAESISFLWLGPKRTTKK